MGKLKQGFNDAHCGKKLREKSLREKFKMMHDMPPIMKVGVLNMYDIDKRWKVYEGHATDQTPEHAHSRSRGRSRRDASLDHAQNFRGNF